MSVNLEKTSWIITIHVIVMNDDVSRAYLTSDNLLKMASAALVEKAKESATKANDDQKETNPEVVDPPIGDLFPEGDPKKEVKTDPDKKPGPKESCQGGDKIPPADPEPPSRSVCRSAFIQLYVLLVQAAGIASLKVHDDVIQTMTGRWSDILWEEVEEMFQDTIKVADGKASLCMSVDDIKDNYSGLLSAIAALINTENQLSKSEKSVGRMSKELSTAQLAADRSEARVLDLEQELTDARAEIETMRPALSSWINADTGASADAVVNAVKGMLNDIMISNRSTADSISSAVNGLAQSAALTAKNTERQLGELSKDVRSLRTTVSSTEGLITKLSFLDNAAPSPYYAQEKKASGGAVTIGFGRQPAADTSEDHSDDRSAKIPVKTDDSIPQNLTQLGAYARKHQIKLTPDQIATASKPGGVQQVYWDIRQ